jgi:hypothetical protein
LNGSLRTKQEGGNMTTTLVPPPQTAARPLWATSLGILAILMGAQEMWAWGSHLPLVSERGPLFVRPLSLGDCLKDWSGLPVSALSITAGILLLKQRRIAKGFFIAYAILAIATQGYVVVDSMGRFMDLGARPSVDLVRLMQWFPYLVLPYPLFCLIWFLRKRITQEMWSWR